MGAFINAVEFYFGLIFTYMNTREDSKIDDNLKSWATTL